ncbi:hypothetical protein AgCh_037814 [Apium graveolens]
MKYAKVSCPTDTTKCALSDKLLTINAGTNNTPTSWAAAERALPSSFGAPTHNCVHCGATLWYEERIKRNRHTSNPQFTFCCMEGRVKLPLMKDPPPLLKHLLGPDSGQQGSNFRRNIRPYNSMFAVASLGVQVDKLINKSRGPYVFRASGQIYHNTSSLLPPTGKKPLFAQLYIYDTDHEISNRINTLKNAENTPAIDENIFQGLTQMLDENSNLTRSYRKARDMFEAQPQTTFHLRLPEARTRDGRQYNIPTESEVGGLIVGELTETKFECDVIVRHRTKGITYIDELHPSYMSMAYPLIHPYGEDGYRLGYSKEPMRGIPYFWRDGSCNNIEWMLTWLLSKKGLAPQWGNQLSCHHRILGYPDLFITFTCNPKWPEINDMLGLIGQKDDRNRVDIVCRVFEIKLQQLMYYIKKEQPFGEIMACLYTIEFQKRGLPHAHILLFFHSSRKNPSPEYIDSIISAELPDINVDPDAYNAVKKSMLHGPCGQANTSSPCMLQGKCNKFFPKKFNETTTIGEDGYPIYRRGNTGITIEKKGTLLDNRFVIPYNKNLLVKFDAHINVELCNSARSIKYLFKYINKGPDRATAVIETTNERDEIRAYLDCSMPGIEKTKFTEWLETNKQNEDARTLTYAEFPKHWVWNSKGKLWTRRKKGKAVGRIYFAHPSSGERFYMRMLLNFVKGSTSFECIRTVNGVTYPTFKAACYALGLLDDDREWVDCLSEAAVWATGNELRNLFVTILIFFHVSNVPELWKTHSQILSEDMFHIQRKRFQFPTLQLTTAQTEAYALVEIESLMQKLGKSLKDIDGMSQPDSSLTRDIGNGLLNEELNYDRAALKILHEKSLHALNHFQRIAYDAIVRSVQRDEGKLFFISGHGGTGKTFLWNTITSKLRSDSMIVLPVTTSGITSLLLPNGRTTHSRFRIPLDVAVESTCEIKHGTQLAELLQKTSLIIWDEAPMTHRYCFEALDKSLRDILSTRYEDSRSKPFGGLTVVCGGDFRQILPVIPQGQEIIRIPPELYRPTGENPMEDIVNEVFTHGQVYVALSRVTELQGLVIVNADSEANGSTLLDCKSSFTTIVLVKNSWMDSKVFSRTLLAKILCVSQSASVQTVVCFPYSGGVVELGTTDLEDNGKEGKLKRPKTKIDENHVLGSRGKKKRKDAGVEEKESFWNHLPGRSLAKNQTIWLCNARYADSKVFCRTLLAKILCVSQSASVQTVVCFPYSGGVVELGTTDLEDNGKEGKLKRPKTKIDENHVLGSRGKKKRKDAGVEEKESFWNHLPGRSLAKNQTIWLCNARYADSKVFSRTLLAKILCVSQSASVQTVVCFPYSCGVVELGTTDLVAEGRKREKMQALKKRKASGISEIKTTRPFQKEDILKEDVNVS